MIPESTSAQKSVDLCKQPSPPDSPSAEMNLDPKSLNCPLCQVLLDCSETKRTISSYWSCLPESNEFLQYYSQPSGTSAYSTSNTWVRQAINTNTLDNVCLYWEEIIRLKPTMWLNDEIVNQFCSLLHIISQKHAHLHRSYFVNSLTSTSCFSRNHTKPMDKISKNVFGGNTCITGVNRLFFPCHSNNHWTLAVVYVDERVIMHYDSLGGESHEFYPRLIQWLRDYAGILDIKPWDFPVIVAKTPQQQNEFDCGVVMLMAAEYILHGWDLNFSTSKDQIVSFRYHIAISLLQRTIYRRSECICPPLSDNFPSGLSNQNSNMCAFNCVIQIVSHIENLKCAFLSAYNDCDLVDTAVVSLLIKLQENQRR